MNPRVDQAAWITPQIMLLVGSFGRDVAGDHVALDGKPAEFRSFSYEGVSGDSQLATLRLALAPASSDRYGSLTFSRGRRELACDPGDLVAALVDPQTLLRTSLAPLPARIRGEILSFLAATADAHPAAAGASLTTALHAIREALRERLSPCLVGRELPVGLAVECILAIDDRRFFLQGWFRDANSPASSLRAISPEGGSVELIDTLFRFRRPDLESFYGVPPGDQGAGTGFACSFDLQGASSGPSGWILELRNEIGDAVEVPAPAAITAPNEVRNMLLSDIGLERPGEDELTRKHLYPSLLRLQERNAQRLRIDRVVQLGTPPTDPDVTIVVPLYRRIDFLQHQLAQFALDPQISRADLVYVLDSPELSRDLLEMSAALAELYRLPFRVVILGQNVGYAGANRAGVSVARGRLLLLLNSDVLPEDPGWLDQMTRFYDSKPRIGALGPQLLFEDESLQHAGLFFRRRVQSTFWVNDHYFKGLHRELPAANLSRVVPGVTGACMMVDRVLFHEAGGFSGSFVRGDFEDSDFCLRLVERGLENWYYADVSLFHLEGQSYEAPLRVQASRYNAWLQSHLWGSRIEALMEGFETPAGSRGSDCDALGLEPSTAQNGSHGDGERGHAKALKGPTQSFEQSAGIEQPDTVGELRR